MALFSVTIITYVITARLYGKSALAVAKLEQYGNPPQQLAHRALLDFLRGSRNPSSPFRYDSLLEDLYGNDHVVGELSGLWADAAKTYPGTNGQILDLTVRVQGQRPTWLPASTPRNRWNLSDLPHYYDGAVLTFTSGPAAGRSTRILEYAPAGTDRDAHLYIFAFDRDDPSSVASADLRPPRFLINGRANNGSGLGFSPTTGFLDYVNPTVNFPQTLLPHYTVADVQAYDQTLLSFLKSAPATVALSLSDEGYDAVDHQNMFLAMVVPTPGDSTSVVAHERTPLSGGYVPTPSFHRPDLMRYWARRLGLESDALILDRNQSPIVQAVARRVSFRPVHQQPRFHAMNPRYESDPAWNNRVDLSNPALPTPVAPPWDVDNDGDSLPDSVWMDLGYPVQTGPDGRAYKPLVAILCTDLDGRLNLNAHGSLAQADDTLREPGPSGVPDNYSAAAGLLNSDGRFSRGAVPKPMITTFGLGFGPADVNLGVLFADNREYRALLQGISPDHSLAALSAPMRVPGRYGELTDNSASGAWGGPQAGLAGTGALLANARWGHFPHRRGNIDFCFADFINDVSSAGSLPDLWGTGFVGIDHRGHPLYRGAGGWNYSGSAHWNSPRYYHVTRNNPYQIDLSRPAARASASLVSGGNWSNPLDAPFTVHELEPLLRHHDRDVATLPNRIEQLANATFSGADRKQAAARHMVTTDSWDVPSPSLQILPELANFLPGKQALTIFDLLYARMRAANPVSFKPALVPTAIRFYLSPEVRLGQKFNLNRPFGDGQDSNNNGVVDEALPDEASNDLAPLTNHADSNGYPYWHNNGQTLGPQDSLNDGTQKLFARQIYARQLYVLAMLVCDTLNGQLPASSPNTPGGNSRTARALAQWAVNVVDFSDRDSVMTYFEYDPLPFTDENQDGHPWDVDGRPNPLTGITTGVEREQRNEVWGCERPELLITETYASHDRRTRDTKDAGRGYTAANGMGPQDKDLHPDQIRRPQGNLIVELYNPQSPSDAPSREVSTRATQPGPTDLLGDGPTNDHAVDLTAYVRVPRFNGASRVWRLAVLTEQASAINQPNVSVPPVLQPADIERLGYFCPSVPVRGRSGEILGGFDELPDTAFGRFYGTTLDRTLLPGHYAVVAPSPSTAEPAETRIYLGRRQNLGDQTLENNHPAYLRFRANDVDSVGIANAIAQPRRKPTLPILMAPRFVDREGFNSPTEHEAFRKLRFSVSEPKNGYTVKDGVSRTDDDAFIASPKDEPFDIANDGSHFLTEPLENHESKPFRVICLQRLANPFVEMNLLTNPYVTVDSQVVDLAVYSSEEDPARPDGPNPASISTLNVRQRGVLQATTLLGPNVWSAASTAPKGPAGNALDNPLSSQTFGYLNQTFGKMGGLAFPYNGDPAVPFPWFPWHNRPFTSQMELLLVPRGSSATMLQQHSVRGRNGFNPFAANANQQAEFTQLLGFFDAAPDSTPPAHLYRLLEFVHAPSRFSGAESILDGALFGDPENSAADRFHLRPPFHAFSRYREPGRINLNTIFSSSTWRALLGAPRPSLSSATDAWVKQSWEEFVTSRRGYGPVSDDFTAAEPALPSYTCNPFRSYAGGHLGVSSHLGSNGRTPGVEATLLRSTALNQQAPFKSDATPLLSPRNIDAPYRDSLRHPYFRYQGHERLGSLATTRSNVFAVWLTVGYFEAERVPTPNADAYPDGYWLGAELGADTGQINRHRAFYIIDRTRTAAFEPGEDHNVEQTILTRRHIE